MWRRHYERRNRVRQAGADPVGCTGMVWQYPKPSPAQPSPTIFNQFVKKITKKQHKKEAGGLEPVSQGSRAKSLTTELGEYFVWITYLVHLNTGSFWFPNILATRPSAHAHTVRILDIFPPDILKL